MYRTFRIVAIAGLLATAALSLCQGPHAKITAAQATKAALAKYHGTTVGKVELENEDGKWQYAVIIRSGKKMREVMVDANTGKIANVEVVTAGEEAKEKAAEAKQKHKKGKGGK
jgi:hypothetical protein